MYVKGASKSEKAPNGSTYLACAESEEIKKLLKWMEHCLARLLLLPLPFVTGSCGPTCFSIFCVFYCYFVTFAAVWLNFGTAHNFFNIFCHCKIWCCNMHARIIWGPNTSLYYTTTILWPFVQDYLGEPVPEGWWGGNGISWTICKSFALCFRQITMSTPHHSVFYGLDALPATQPTASKH